MHIDTVIFLLEPHTREDIVDAENDYNFNVIDHFFSLRVGQVR